MDTKLSFIFLIFAFIVEFISAKAPLADALICPRYKCDSSMKQCATMVGDATYGKNVTLNGCTNSTRFECLFTESMVIENPTLNISCTAKTAPTKTRYNN